MLIVKDLYAQLDTELKKGYMFGFVTWISFVKRQRILPEEKENFISIGGSL